MPMKLYVGDIVQTKKKHPCGADQWEILRVGMDFRMRCTGCGHQVWIPRVKLEKSIKKVLVSHAPEAAQSEPAQSDAAQTEPPQE